MDLIKEDMLRQGYCLRCCAYFGERHGKKCNTLEPGCPVPEDLRLKWSETDGTSTQKKKVR